MNIESKVPNSFKDLDDTTPIQIELPEAASIGALPMISRGKTSSPPKEDTLIVAAARPVARMPSAQEVGTPHRVGGDIAPVV